MIFNRNNNNSNHNERPQKRRRLAPTILEKDPDDIDDRNSNSKIAEYLNNFKSPNSSSTPTQFSNSNRRPRSNSILTRIRRNQQNHRNQHILQNQQNQTTQRNQRNVNNRNNPISSSILSTINKTERVLTDIASFVLFHFLFSGFYYFSEPFVLQYIENSNDRENLIINKHIKRLILRLRKLRERIEALENEDNDIDYNNINNDAIYVIDDSSMRSRSGYRAIEGPQSVRNETRPNRGNGNEQQTTNQQTANIMIAQAIIGGFSNNNRNGPSNVNVNFINLQQTKNRIHEHNQNISYKKNVEK